MQQKNFDGDFIKYSEKKVKAETHNLAWYLFSRITLYIIILFFALFFIWYTAFVTTHRFYAVSGVSMMPTLNAQIELDEMDSSQKKSFDAVYVDIVNRPEIFDIIVIKRAKEDSIIKRLMAVEGDLITIAQTTNSAGDECLRFYRIPNGQTLSDEQAQVIEDGSEGDYHLLDADSLWTHKVNKNAPEVATLSATKNGNTSSHKYEYNFFTNFLSTYQDGSENFYVSDDGLVYAKVPQGMFFYMGDNRAHSTDARENGFCDLSNIVGRTEFFVKDYNFANRLWEVVKYYFKEIDKFFAR